MTSTTTKQTPIKAALSMLLVLSFVISNAITAFATLNPQLVKTATATNKFTTDLTQLGRNGRLRENLSLEKETLRLIEVLAKGGLRQPVIVDDNGDVQNAIVEEVARRIAKGNVPDALKNTSIVKLEGDALFSNLKSEAEVSEAMASIVDEITSSDR